MLGHLNCWSIEEYWLRSANLRQAGLTHVSLVMLREDSDTCDMKGGYGPSALAVLLDWQRAVHGTT